MDRFASFTWAGILSILATGPICAQAQRGAVGPNTSPLVSVSQVPWFSNQDIRSRLNFNDQQFNALNKAYGDAYARFNAGVGQLDNSLNAQERARKMQDLQATFNQNFGKSVQDTITDPQQRQRYNQMYLQYQGFGAFNDPMVQQKLNLTDEQRQKLLQFGNEWNTQMQTYSTNYQNDANGQRWAGMRKQYNDRLNSVLTDQQQQTWRQLTGDPYNFQPSIFFQNTPTTNPPQNNGK